MLNKETGAYHIAAGSDYKAWRKDLLLHYMYDCLMNNLPIVIDITPEASSFRANGLYRFLDAFCEANNYDKNKITLRTGNMIEWHDEYCVERMAVAWYELLKIRTWSQQNPIDITNTPTKHFGHFIGKSNWNRLWVASLINSRYADKALQTYNTGIGSHYFSKTHDRVDYVGLEDLVKYNCNILPAVIEFLETCPRIIPEDLAFIKGRGNYINKLDDCYPIQMPNNLNIINYYNSIFVDVVHETYMANGVFFCTEKTWRPILAHRPFIAVGPANHLSNLKRLGFRTFNEHWDEGYDEYGASDKIHQVGRLLETISQWSLAELASKLDSMQDIFEHNYQTLLSLTPTRIEKIFVNDR